MNRIQRASAVLSLVAGSALVADTVTVINRSFESLDSLLLLPGLVTWIVAAGPHPSR